MKKCKDCAVKHLRAALAYAESDGNDVIPFRPNVSVMTLVSRAYVLATEAASYPAHYDVAIGTLVMAEEEASMMPGEVGIPVALSIRDIRIKSSNASSLAYMLRKFPLCDPFIGHVMEAMREGDIAELPEVITRKWISENYSVLVKAASEEKVPDVAEGTTEQKGGEEVMAKCAKKCATKGGCAKKAACKGGSCKKGSKKCCK